MVGRGDPRFKEDERSNESASQIDWLYTTDVGAAERLLGDGGPGPVRGYPREDHGR